MKIEINQLKSIQDVIKYLNDYAESFDIQDSDIIKCISVLQEYADQQSEVNDRCPECGYPEYTNENELGKGFRLCKKCKQEWWSDINYTKQSKVSGLPSDEEIESQARIYENSASFSKDTSIAAIQATYANDDFKAGAKWIRNNYQQSKVSDEEIEKFLHWLKHQRFTEMMYDIGIDGIAKKYSDEVKRDTYHPKQIDWDEISREFFQFQMSNYQGTSSILKWFKSKLT